MNPIKIGVICPSEIAFRRFLPSLQKTLSDFSFVGVAIASPLEWFGSEVTITEQMKSQQQNSERVKAQSFINNYGGHIFDSYYALVTSDDIDAVYIPLPPALHFQWAKQALEAGKHVFVEKPSTTCLSETDELLQLALEKSLAIHENYMFIYHSQLDEINNIVKKGDIGNVRLYRITFGFPLRQLSDFRYNKKLGGGALLDAGGYCLKYANYLLGNNANVVAAQANSLNGFEVDMYGSATVVNEEGDVVQIAFGMDNDYRCDIEIWGSKGTITSNRILTAPDGFTPSYTLKQNQMTETHTLEADDAFLKSLLRFRDCVNDAEVRKEEYEILHHQEVLVEQFVNKTINIL